MISTQPLYDDYRDVLEIKASHVYGVYEPADSPEAWSTISHISPGPHAGILLTDRRNNRVHLVVPGSGVVVSFGKGTGDGPGEFRYAAASAWDGGDEIYIADQRQLRTSVFTVDGEFKRSFRIHDAGTVAADSIGVFWITGSFRGRPYLVRRYSMATGQYLGEVGGRYSEQPWAEAFYATVVACPAGVLVGESFPYEIAEYTSAGDVVRRFGRDVPWLLPPERNDRGLWQRQGGSIRGLACFPDGKSLVYLWRLIESQEIWFEGYFDLFESDGSWVATIPADDIREDSNAVCFGIATDGALWVYWDGDYPTVTRYEIRFLSPQTQ